MERKDYKRYSREFKLEAVRLAAVGDRPKAQIAREPGIRVNQLRKWRLDFEEEERTVRPSEPRPRKATSDGFGERTPSSRRRTRS